MPESLLNRQLTLEFFQQQIGAEIIHQIQKITFCGNDGDPIYCREFLEICQWIKHINPKIMLVVITNGSHKPMTWWHDLGQILNENDEINWSIDGWDQSSNEQYRVNSQWSSIMEGYLAFKRSNRQTYCTWATIAFRFNQNMLDRIKTRAQEIGFDLWQLTKSTKFGSHYPDVYGERDALQPTDPRLISQGHRFQRELCPLTDRIRPSDKMKIIFLDRSNDLKGHSGICLIGNKGVFLNSQGEFYPCCWTANRFGHNKMWHDLAKSKFNLYHHTFQEIISNEFWSTEFLRFDSLECQTKCTADKLKDREHVTEW